MKTKKPLIESTEPEVSEAQLAEHFDVGDATIRRWKRAGMPTKKYNSRLYRYKLSEVEYWLQERGKELAARADEKRAIKQPN
jgi:phage terminase Nu1 subunit (DNA packaging protein)